MHSTTILPSTQAHLEPVTMHCKQCMVAFDVAYDMRYRQKYCSDECRNAANERYQYICQHCGITYRTAHKERNKFCSRDCAFAHRATKPTQPKETKLLNCQQCGGAFEQNNTELFCSSECRKIYNARKTREYAERNHAPTIVKCKECGGEFERGYGDKRRVFCGVHCANRWAKRLDGGTLNQRARKALRKFYGKLTPKVYQVIKPIKVYERDHWQCKICGQPIDQQAEPCEPLSASVDHIVPLASGGTHTYANVQAAHFECNWRKGAS